MARSRDRIIALILAIVFFLTSLTLTFWVVFELIQGNKESSNMNQTAGERRKGKPLTDFTPIAQVDALQKIDITPGTGREITPTDTVTVDYTGAIAATGIVFESSYDRGQPYTTQLDSVIQGWTEGIPGMKVGGTRRLIIPAAMAYGDNPQSPDIPKGAALVFDVTVHDAQAPTE